MPRIPTFDKGTIYETFHIDAEKGDKVIEKVKELVHEGNVRKIIVRNAKGETVIEAPLSFGVAGAALAPVWAAIGAIAAIMADLTVTVEKKTDAEPHG